MKKIISLILVVLCAFSLVACGNGDSEGVLTKIKPSGTEVDSRQYEGLINERIYSNLVSDKAKLDNLGDQWFKIDMKIVEESKTTTSLVIREYKETIEVKGIICLTAKGKLNIKVEFLSQTEGYGKDHADGKEEKRLLKTEGKIIAVDDVAYMDVKETVVRGGVKQTEENKIATRLIEIYDPGFIGILTEGFYGMTVYEKLQDYWGFESGEEIVCYVDGDKAFVEFKVDEESSNEERKSHSQIEIKYAEKSAILEGLRFYSEVREKTSSSINEYKNTSIIKRGLIITRCEPVAITAPDVNDYEWS